MCDCVWFLKPYTLELFSCFVQTWASIHDSQISPGLPAVSIGAFTRFSDKTSPAHASLQALVQGSDFQLGWKHATPRCIYDCNWSIDHVTCSTSRKAKLYLLPIVLFVGKNAKSKKGLKLPHCICDFEDPFNAALLAVKWLTETVVKTTWRLSQGKRGKAQLKDFCWISVSKKGTAGKNGENKKIGFATWFHTHCLEHPLLRNTPCRRNSSLTYQPPKVAEHRTTKQQTPQQSVTT